MFTSIKTPINLYFSETFFLGLFKNKKIINFLPKFHLYNYFRNFFISFVGPKKVNKHSYLSFFVKGVYIHVYVHQNP